MSEFYDDYDDGGFAEHGEDPEYWSRLDRHSEMLTEETLSRYPEWRESADQIRDLVGEVVAAAAEMPWDRMPDPGTLARDVGPYFQDLAPVMVEAIVAVAFEHLDVIRADLA